MKFEELCTMCGFDCSEDEIWYNTSDGQYHYHILIDEDYVSCVQSALDDAVTGSPLEEKMRWSDTDGYLQDMRNGFVEYEEALRRLSFYLAKDLLCKYGVPSSLSESSKIQTQAITLLFASHGWDVTSFSSVKTKEKYGDCFMELRSEEWYGTVANHILVYSFPVCSSSYISDMKMEFDFLSDEANADDFVKKQATEMDGSCVDFSWQAKVFIDYVILSLSRFLNALGTAETSIDKEKPFRINFFQKRYYFNIISESEWIAEDSGCNKEKAIEKIAYDNGFWVDVSHSTMYDVYIFKKSEGTKTLAWMARLSSELSFSQSMARIADLACGLFDERPCLFPITRWNLPDKPYKIPEKGPHRNFYESTMKLSRQFQKKV